MLLCNLEKSSLENKEGEMLIMKSKRIKQLIVMAMVTASIATSV